MQNDTKERYRLVLYWIPRDGPRREMELIGNDFLIGRVAGNDITVPVGNMSKRHQRLVVRDGKLFIIDMKSTNGSYVNGRRINAPQVLTTGDKVYISDFTYGMVSLEQVDEDTPLGGRWLAPPERRARVWPIVDDSRMDATTLAFGDDPALGETVPPPAYDGGPLDEVWTRCLLEPVFGAAERISLAGVGDDTGQALVTRRSDVWPEVFAGGDAAGAAMVGALNALWAAGHAPEQVLVDVELQVGAHIQEVRRQLRSLVAWARRAQVHLCLDRDAVWKQPVKGRALSLMIAATGPAHTGATFTHADDGLLLTGAVGAHGLTTLGLEAPHESDLGLLEPLIAALRRQGIHVRDGRALDRPGSLRRIKDESAQWPLSFRHIDWRWDAVTFAPGVAEVAAAHGDDPLTYASGRAAVLLVDQPDRALAVARGVPGGEGAALIGRVAQGPGDER
jgi:hypothetical protein